MLTTLTANECGQRIEQMDMKIIDNIDRTVFNVLIEAYLQEVDPDFNLPISTAVGRLPKYKANDLLLQLLELIESSELFF